MPEGVSDAGPAGPGSGITVVAAGTGAAGRNQGEPDGYRRSYDFAWPEEVPWSDLGESFMKAWGRTDDGAFMADHWEISGQSGSGKSYLLGTALQQRAALRGSSEVVIVTKEDDDSIPLLGWPVVSDFAGIKENRQSVFWPQTKAKGEDREKYHERKLYDLLARLWAKEANTVVAFDEIGYVESLSNRMKKLIRMYWREARSNGISIVAMKQRPIGVVRDQHSESRWKAVFCPADHGDMPRFAELLGHPRDWIPVLEALDQTRHQFVLRNTFTRESYISWVDSALRPLPSQRPAAQRRSPKEYLWGRHQAA